jgi:hypothetical protein
MIQIELDTVTSSLGKPVHLTLRSHREAAQEVESRSTQFSHF